MIGRLAPCQQSALLYRPRPYVPDNSTQCDRRSCQRRRAAPARLRTFVAIYWKPLYKYLRVARIRDGADAEDLTQAFLAKCFESGSLATYDAARASFRIFLRILFDRYVANEVKASLRQKRGGGRLALDFDTAEQEITREHDRGGSPEDYFQREWVRSVFALAVERLRDECYEAGDHNPKFFLTRAK